MTKTMTELAVLGGYVRRRRHAPTQPEGAPGTGIELFDIRRWSNIL
jgi:hypothetical protein